MQQRIPRPRRTLLRGDRLDELADLAGAEPISIEGDHAWFYAHHIERLLSAMERSRPGQQQAILVETTESA